jgi:hypothetical protein
MRRFDATSDLLAYSRAKFFNLRATPRRQDDFELLEPTALPDAIVEAMAPAFILAAMASWVSAMANRLERITDRVRYLLDLEKSGSIGEQGAADLANLKALAATVEQSMFWMITGATLIVLYVILAFILQIFSLHYHRLIGCVFVLALVCLLISLVRFAWAVWLRRNNRLWI